MPKIVGNLDGKIKSEKREGCLSPLIYMPLMRKKQESREWMRERNMAVF